MKKLRLSRPVVMLLMVLFPLAATSALKGIYYNATYDFSNRALGTDTLGGVTYLTVNYDGLDNDGEPGMPSLPVDYIRFSVPWNATNFSVQAQLRNTVTQDISQLVYPCQQPRLMSDTTPVVITPPDSAAYLNYPLQRAWVVDEGYLAGENHIVTVAVMPISFNMIGTGGINYNQLKKTPTITLMLSYQLSDSLAMYPIVRQDSVLRQEGYALTRSMVVNPSSVEAHATGEIQSDYVFNPTSGDGLNGGPHIDPTPPPVYEDSIIGTTEQIQIEEFPYLIVTTQEMLHSVRRIAALKRQKGYGVKVVTLDEVLASPLNMGGDHVLQADGSYQLVDSSDEGKIRQYLKYYYCNYRTDYVLLAGNSIPYKIKHEAATDWYYSDLNGDFRKDFEESVKDSCDFYAELNVGRLLAKTPDQIDNYTNKLLTYELNPGHGDYTFLRKAIVTQGRELEIINDFHLLVQNRLSKLFANVNHIEELEGQNFPTGKNIIDSINTNKYGFICSLNHGSPEGINVYGHHCPSNVTRHYIWAIDSIRNMPDSETGNGLNNLHNKYYPMIYYSISCETMPFGYNNSSSFGESFTMGKDYGGPVYIGYNAQRIFNGIAFTSLRCFLTNLSISNYNLGKAYSLSKKGQNGSLLTRFPWEALSQNYLGDPSIEMWSDIPQMYSNINVARGDSAITLSGIDVKSSIVVILDKHLKLTKSMVTSDSVSFNRISPNSTIMLYKHNYIPYIVPMSLQNEVLNKSQYVIASDVTAGYSIDNNRNRTPGDVIVKNGVEYEVEASGTVTLQDGFKVEKGATFAVYPASF